MLNGRFTYDGLGKQLHIRNMGIVNNKPSAKDLLILYNEGVLNNIDYSKWTCKKRLMNSDFIPLGVPEGATQAGQVVAGSSSLSGMDVLVNSWKGAIHQGNGYYQSTFTEFGCLPMTNLLYTPQTHWTSISYYNILLGIMNPMDFIPPFFCQKAKLESHETNFIDALKSVTREIVSEA
ncbi:ependymin-like [Alosa alosa]|uniref:ependymin-like n=1 Tax=Alosa alosa TaxID=278164 RepID=UPI00201549FA|nr:ependymin-like [Alosa alosa]